MAWLRMIREDLDIAPFDNQGVMGRMYKLFVDRVDGEIEKLNERLAG